MKIGVIGSGVVGKTLAAGFLKHGHAVTIGTREAGKLKDWAAEHPSARKSPASPRQPLSAKSSSSPSAGRWRSTR